jgi:hypothetical protein
VYAAYKIKVPWHHKTKTTAFVRVYSIIKKQIETTPKSKLRQQRRKRNNINNDSNKMLLCMAKVKYFTNENKILKRFFK